jgi:hypothetical protein
MKPLPRAKIGKPGTVSPDSWNRLIDELEAMKKRVAALTPHASPDITHKHSQNGFTSHLTRRRGGGGGSTIVPFPVSLLTIPGETPTYQVKVGLGYVIERCPGASDALAYHKPANMFVAVDPPTDPVSYTDNLTPFDIAVGQAVYIRCEVDENGEIATSSGDAVTIVVDEDEESSSHYTPRVDTLDTAGDAGFYLYKLAVLKEPVAPSTTPTLERWMTGSHIDHFQDLPAMLSALAAGTGVGVIPKEWSDSEKAYKLRAIRQKSPVAEVPPEGGDPGSPAQEVQIHVIQETDAVRIQGNSKKRTVKYQIGSASPVDVVIFDDGLETMGNEAGNDIVIPIPAGGEDVLFQWKTTKATATTIDIAEGKVYTQSGFTGTTAAAVFGLAVSASGFAICTITRNASTRAITSAVSSYVTGTPAASTYTTQIVPLAQVIFTSGAIEKIIQLKFEELHIFEDLVIENGEFRLADLLMAGRNIYEPPPP